ncbi:MAG: zinc metalloprotease HtpX [Pseudomonadota bacterium]|nr:zinc metalloprotease HtpX [Pseudomonadota bacterium]
MATPIDSFEQHGSDWRKSLQKNRRRTIFVITSFLLIYAMLGFFIDMYLLSAQYPNAPFDVYAAALFSFTVTPIATLILTGVASLALLVTFKFHDKLMLLGTESREITAESAANLKEKQLYNIVDELRVASGLKYMPKVYIIEANYMNAFASGYSEKSAMMAITSGLLDKLDRAETQAVMAHEISHIRHGDIKLTLMASVLTNIMLITIDFFFYNIVFGRRDEKGDNRFLVVVMVLRYLLPLVTVLLTLYLSRTREYMADAGCVELMRDNNPMARALLKIQQDTEQNAPEYNQEYAQTPHEDVRRAAYIFDPTQAGISSMKTIASLFSTHPPVEKRLEALGFRQREP